MNKMIRKFKDKSGASLMLALLVFLICAMVGASVLAAATASTGVVTTTWTDDADVYAMKSAATMFNDTFTSAHWQSATETKNTDNTLNKPTSINLDTLYQGLCIVTYNKNGAGSAKETLTITAGGKTVNADVTMDSSYNVTAVFTTSNSVRKVTSVINASPSEGTDTRAKGASVSFLTPVITVQ